MTFKDGCKKLWRFFKKSLGYIADGNPGQIFRDIKSWWHFRHVAWLDILSYDKESNMYRLDRKTIRMKDVLPNYLQVSGNKYHYFYTELPAPHRQEYRTEVRDGVEYRFLNTSAVSNYLYMINNDIENAIQLKKQSTVSPGVLAVLIGLAVIGVVWFLFLR